MHWLRDAYRFVFLLLLLATATAQAQPDPLPSWTDGPTKAAIIDFVERVTEVGGPDFVPVEQRIATFDNDGTLWSEQPVVEGMFALERLRAKAVEDPSLRERQPFKAALEGDKVYFSQAGPQAVAEVLALTHAGMSETEFAEAAAAFLRRARHPDLGVPYTALVYQPMLELLAYLRENGFQTWLCSGGSQEFMRVIAQPLYGIPPERVIGTRFDLKPSERDGRIEFRREPRIATLNDKQAKPLNIHVQIGQRPLFAVGNVHSGGDIAMLTYSAERSGPSFQLLIDHDDARREFAYQEPDNASLSAAREGGWTVVSMKRDWQRVFAQPQAQSDRQRSE